MEWEAADQAVGVLETGVAGNRNRVEMRDCYDLYCSWKQERHKKAGKRKAITDAKAANDQVGG